MSPNGAFHLGADGNPLTTTKGDTVSIDTIAWAGGYTWGRIANNGWDWIVLSHGRAREAGSASPAFEKGSNWTGGVRVLVGGNVRSSPNGGVLHRIRVGGSIRAWPDGSLRGDAATRSGEIVSITDTMYRGEWLWGRLDGGLWDWIALERRDRTEKRLEFVTTSCGDVFTIAEQETAGDWIWGRIADTGAWVAIENRRTGEVRFERIGKTG